MSKSVDEKLLIANLRELSDASLQMRRWVLGSEGNMSSFSEVVSGAFDDARLARGLDSGQFAREHSVQAAALARALSTAIERVPEFESPQRLVVEPAMNEVRRLAGELLGLLEAP